MFTGIVSDVGRIAAIEPHDRGARIAVACGYAPGGIEIGASIACAGVCLTVVGCAPEGGGSRFEADVSAETLSCTTLGVCAAGDPINLERALRMGDELGGHMVQGHVDGVAEVSGRDEDGQSIRFELRAPADLARFIAPKGSIALDGTSLTVNSVRGEVFSVNLVPHTSRMTTWGTRRVGDRVNLEVDLVARYLARLASSNGTDV
jgi:riboflavin synthase